MTLHLQAQIRDGAECIYISPSASTRIQHTPRPCAKCVIIILVKFALETLPNTTRTVPPFHPLHLHRDTLSGTARSRTSFRSGPRNCTLLARHFLCLKNGTTSRSSLTRRQLISAHSCSLAVRNLETPRRLPSSRGPSCFVIPSVIGYFVLRHSQAGSLGIGTAFAGVTGTMIGGSGPTAAIEHSRHRLYAAGQPVEVHNDGAATR